MRANCAQNLTRAIFGTVPIAFSAVAPSVVQMNVDVGATLSGVTLIGPRGIRTFHIPSLTVAAADHELALGDTAFAPLALRWKEGNFNWNFAPCSALPPPGSTARTILANTSLHHWAIMPRLAATYFNPRLVGK